MISIVSQIRTRRQIIGKFILVSGSAVLLNLLLLHLMVRYLGLNTAIGENIANILSLEISVIYNFFLSREFTWGDRPREHGVRLILQIVKFHAAIGITTIMRISLFAFLQQLGVFYLINAAIGIAIASLFNFIAYNALVFNERT